MEKQIAEAAREFVRSHIHDGKFNWPSKSQMERRELINQGMGPRSSAYIRNYLDQHPEMITQLENEHKNRQYHRDTGPNHDEW